jgi:hypothetical protein
MSEEEKHEYNSLPEENELEIHPIAQDSDFQLSETSTNSSSLAPSSSPHNSMESKLNQVQQLVDIVNK